MSTQIYNKVNPKTIEKTIEGVNTQDYPDFADAYVIVEYAEYKDGTALDSNELERLGEELTDDGIKFDEIVNSVNF